MQRTALFLLAFVSMLGTSARAQQSADALLARMTVEEKAGQLFMCWILSTDDGTGTAPAKMKALVKDLGIGGVILSLGTAADAKRLGGELQDLAKVPLWLGSDFEGGVTTRFTGATPLGYPMLLGATGSTRLAREHGRVTGEEASALGVHLVFAPDLDVNTNPLNPIINARSFGESAPAVARLGTAFVEGLQSTGCIATGKHFPGHGDTVADSHKELPVVPGDRAQLERTSLLPFRTAIKAGLQAVMSGHLTVEALGVPPDRSATLEASVMTKLLREEMGFTGLAITDALDMQAITRGQPPGDAAVRALLAGADVLLMPPDPIATHGAVVAAVKSGRVPMARLDEAVRRILGAKERLGLLAGRRGGRDDWKSLIEAKAHRDVAREIARRGITLVRDDAELLPLTASRSAHVVNVVAKESDLGRRALRQRLMEGHLKVSGHAVTPTDPSASWDSAAISGANADVTIVAVHLHYFDVGAEVEARAVAAIRTLLQRRPSSILVLFGDPYLLRQLPEAPTAICAFDSTEPIEEAVGDALLGRAPITGRLPVTIPDVAPLGGGLSAYGESLDAATDSRAAASDLGFRPTLADDVRAFLDSQIARRAFSGAVAVVTRRGQLACEVAAGRETYDAGAPAIRATTRFDLASLTKVCATMPVLARLVEQKKLSLDQKVSELVPAFAGGDKDAVTLRHLMTHCAGLPPFRKFYATLKGRDAIVDAAAREPLVDKPGAKTVYSDLGLILLMACVERVTGRPFETVVTDEVLKPLHMQASGFTHTGTPIDAAPTENCAWRGTVVRGQVHDENAFAMGGVSGHAGLFATARDVARVGNAFLGGGSGWIKRSTASLFTRPASLVRDSSRALVWDTFTPGGSGGNKLSRGAFGHTGFTGTSIWCDPQTDLCIVLLTNRVYPTRDNGLIAEVRRGFHDLVVDHLDEAPGR